MFSAEVALLISTYLNGGGEKYQNITEFPIGDFPRVVQLVLSTPNKQGLVIHDNKNYLISWIPSKLQVSELRTLL